MAQIYQSSHVPIAASTALQESLTQAIELVLTENRQVLKKISYPAIEQLTEEITGAERIFVTGEGRSGLAIRMVAMRLMHLGYQIYVLGETTTPSLRKGDLLIGFSGSGSTENVAMMAAKVKKIGGHIVAVTTRPESPLGKIADVLIEIKATAKQDLTSQESNQFAGSLFEQSSLLLFEAIFHVLSQNLNTSPETLLALHTNLK